MSSAMMKAARSMHLEQARNRLRQRFKAKFLDSRKEPSWDPPVPAVALSTQLPSKNDHLEEARVRIRQRFHEKFPLARSTLATNAAATLPEEEPDSDDLEHLEEARKRLRERFEENFPDFKAFPVTVDGLQHVIRNTEWGRTNAIVVTSATPPHRILHVNKAWEGLCGFSEEEVRGKTFRSLGIQGEFTEADAVKSLSKKLSSHERVGIHLTNAASDGTLFRNYLRVAPLYSNDEITHFIGVLQAQ